MGGVPARRQGGAIKSRKHLLGHVSFSKRLPFILVLCLLGLVLAVPAAQGYTFGAPIVSAIGQERTVFDWSKQACEGWDIPDQSARAFRDYRGKVQLLASHYDTRRAIGSDLLRVRHNCTVVSASAGDPDPSHYDDLEWISAPYTLNGKTIYAIQHMEYRGSTHGTCTPPGSGFADTSKCWYNALTLATSTNGGASYSHATPPGHLVASVPDTFAAMAGNGPDGVFTPSNIVRRSDGYYYLLARTTDFPGAVPGTCVMRTQTLSDPTSWRAWDGSGYTIRFINPYIETSEPRAAHICKHVSTNEIGSMSESLTYNTYLGKYILVGVATPTDPNTGQTVSGFYFSLSDDLIHWSPRKVLMYANTPSLPNCGDPDPVRDPSLLDPTSRSRNFETTGKRPYLYFKRLHVAYAPGYCYWPQDRDLIRIPIEFSGTVPTASFTATPNPALTDEPVSFDASQSGGNQIVKYQWDLDGDGAFERSTTNPILSATFTQPQSGNVSLRVTNSDGLTDDVQRPFTVNQAPYPRPIGASPMRMPLVPAFTQCDPAAADATHQAPLSGGSCNPQSPRSSLIAIGSQSLGFARLVVLGSGACAPFDSTHCYPDVTIRFNVTDVRSGSPTGPDYGTPSAQDLTGVATLPGTVQGSTTRITDQYNQSVGDPTGPYDKSATTVPLNFPVPVDCAATGDPATGSVCSAQTTANTLVPGSVVTGTRAIWELGQLQVLDQGANGVPGDPDDNVFEVQGVFAP